MTGSSPRRSARSGPADDPLASLLRAAGIGHEPERIAGVEWSTAEIAKQTGACVQMTLMRMREAKAAGKVTSRKCRGQGLRGSVEVWRAV